MLLELKILDCVERTRVLEDLPYEKEIEKVLRKNCPHAGSNYRPPVYKTGALPLSYKGINDGNNL